MGKTTPYYLISQNSLDRNLQEYSEALAEIWPNSNLAYSVKTNSLPWILKYLLSKNVLAEVVSDEEYELAKKCGYDDRQIVFNGPIKGEKQFNIATNNGAIVNIDSANDLVMIESIPENSEFQIGIRVNLDPGLFDSNDIGYNDDGFRFGFSDYTGALINAINIVRRKTSHIGLHLHVNSITRSKSVYIAIAKYAAELIQKYNLEISFIDMGGGFFGGVPGKTTPSEYISAIRNELEKSVDISKTKLIIEPGSAIIGSVVDYVTTVVDTKDTSRSRIVTTDGSRINIDPLWIKNRYMYSIETTNSRILEKQVICGYTCMDHDRLMTVENMTELSVGDRIVYHRVGAYTMTLGGMFIRYYPAVYVENNGTITLVRDRTTVDEYYRLNTIR